MENLIVSKIRDEFWGANLNESTRQALFIKVGFLYASLKLTSNLSWFIALPLIYNFLDKDSYVSIIIATAFSLFLATRLRAIAMLLHDAIHMNISKNKKLNILFGRICSVFLTTSWLTYLEDHLKHHRFLGDKTKDPDYNYQIQIDLEKLLNNFFNIKNHKNFFYSLSIYFHQKIVFRNEPIIVTISRIIFVLSIIPTFYYYTGFSGLTYLVLLPFLFFYPLIRWFGDAMDHGLLPSKENSIFTRNHTNRHWLFNFIFLPCNDEFHFTHHLFPNVAHNKLPMAHDLLSKNSSIYAKLYKPKYIIESLKVTSHE